MENETTVQTEFKTRVIPEQARAMVAPTVQSEFSSRETAGGDALSDYTILGRIGGGGMGIVFLAMDRQLGRYVAIKRLRPELRNELSLRRRFLREGKAAAALNNVHIAHIYSIGEDMDGPYIVMEYVESALPKTDAGGPAPSQTLEQYIAQNEPFKLEEALSFILKIGHAIEAAHAAGVIHRDLKSANILMDAMGEPKIVDFGLARFTRSEIVTNLTVQGEKFVSLGYGAPEQESDAALTDERADVYGLGALLFFSLTGKNPRFFREEDLPVSVRPVVCKALATDRDLRYQSVVGFDAAVLSLLAESKTERPTVKTTWRCKWCDTVNPLTTRFCGECGWDGREQCRECSADQQVGIQFCGVCGANAREYEAVANLLRKIRLAMESRQFEWAAHAASQPVTFEPVGPNGRHLLEEIRSLGVLAGQRAKRRDQLKSIIAEEMAATNYERAQHYILEFRELSSAIDAYEDELTSIPRLKQKRDLQRIETAFLMKDWGLGARLLRSMDDVGEEYRFDRKRLERLLEHHHRKVIWIRLCGCFVGGFLLLILLLPPLVRYSSTRIRAGLRLVYELTQNPIFSPLMTGSARLWGMRDLESQWASEDTTDLEVATGDFSSPLTNLQRDFEQQMQVVKRELVAIEKRCGEEYYQALERLRDEQQAAGEFDLWKLYDDEMKRYLHERTIPIEPAAETPKELTSVRLQYHQRQEKRSLELFQKQVTVTHQYIADLEKKVQDFTRQGKMEEADRHNEVLKAFRNHPDFLEAERRLLTK